MAYIRRHTDAETAREVLSETFLVTWRRLDDVPGDALPWLLVVARNTLANHQRSAYRRSLLTYEMQRLAEVSEDQPAVEVAAVESQALLRGLSKLTAQQREALLLTAWDGLTSAQAATVAGCSTATFDVRLHRARARLRRVMADDDLEPAQPSPTRPAAVRSHP
jgi:RNA polymerase sigma-70 factor (ECF subfamily)